MKDILTTGLVKSIGTLVQKHWSRETHSEKALQRQPTLPTLLKPSQQIERSNLLQSDSDWSKWYFQFVGWQQEKEKLHTVASDLQRLVVQTRIGVSKQKT